MGSRIYLDPSFGYGGILKKHLLLLLLLSQVTSCLTKQEGDLGIDESATELSNMPRRWDPAILPLTVYIAQEYQDDLQNYSIVSGKNLFEQMMEQWNLADSNHTFFNNTTDFTTANIDATSLNTYSSDTKIGIYKKTEDWFSNIGTGVLAVTSYIAENKKTYLKMYKADIIVNDASYFSYRYTTSTSSGKYDLPSIILHELGHLIGLNHTSSSAIPSVMQPEISTGDTKRTLHNYDITTIQSLYNNSSFSALSSSGLAIESSDEDSEPSFVQGFIELHADGTCKHFVGGKLIDEHKADIVK